MTTLHYSHLADSVGRQIGPTQPIAITQERIDAFAVITEDRQWIHVDPVRATEGPFGTPIAHGYLSLSLASAFVGQLLEVTGVEALINYGANRVRFPSPVPVGSELRATGEIVAVETGAGWTQLELRLTMETGGSKPVCVADILLRFIPVSAG